MDGKGSSIQVLLTYSYLKCRGFNIESLYMHIQDGKP